MSFKEFKHFGDGHIRLDVDRIVGIGDGHPGRAKIWVQGRHEPFEVEGDPDAIRREIEHDRRAPELATYQKPLG